MSGVLPPPHVPLAPSGDSARPFWQLPDVRNGQRLFGGVASGVAAEIGVDVLLVRLAFVVLFAVGGWGGLLYLIAWGGLSLAAYRGFVSAQPPQAKAKDRPRRLAGLVLVTLGLTLFLGQLGGLRANIIWPLALMGAGSLLALRPLYGAHLASRVPVWVPRLGGLLIAVAGFAGFLTSLDLGLDLQSSFAAAAAVTGLIAFSAPWWMRLVTDLDAERQARARSDERAEVAAHLHDSVLQTLALIQKGEDPQQMVSLARRQERELRNYLDPSRASRSGGSLRGRLDDIASDVEDLFGVPIEVVNVGDALVDDAIEALIGACREAAVNAAKHSGASRIDVFAEVSAQRVEIFVRDTGQGFDPATVGEDRRGVSESIHGRMERAGGEALIHTAPGEGTEVELSVQREATMSTPNTTEEPS